MLRYILTIIIMSYFFLLSCDKDQCDPPFSVGMGLSGVFPIEPITKGQKFGLSFYMFTTYVSQLSNINIKVLLPRQVKMVPGRVLNPFSKEKDNNQLVWVGNLSQRSTEGLFVSLESKTDWSEWETPITVEVGLDFQSTRNPCGNWINGHYGKVITWSKKGYTDSGWMERPKGMEGLDLSK